MSKPDQSATIISSPPLHTTLLPITTFLTILLIILLFYALFKGLTYQFYASFVFLFYSWIKSMWIAVICLGVFQTLLLIPFRLVNLKQAIHTQEFEEKLEGTQKEAQLTALKQKVKQGNFTVLWYMLNFFTQAISYLSIGRLFLTDFYNHPLNPKLLYSFVPYPQYPIMDRFFKLPYPVITKTLDFGMQKVLLFLIVVIFLKIFSSVVVSLTKKPGSQPIGEVEAGPLETIKKVVSFSSSSAVILAVVGWYLIRHFPVGLSFKIFSGDVAIRNYTLNTITAICTALLIIWLDLPKIAKKIQLAKAANIPKKIIRKTQKELFANAVKNAIILGLGAYFITNQIPSAFELSIFTFEIISFASPFTIDRLILNKQKPAAKRTTSLIPPTNFREQLIG